MIIGEEQFIKERTNKFLSFQHISFKIHIDSFKLVQKKCKEIDMSISFFLFDSILFYCNSISNYHYFAIDISSSELPFEKEDYEDGYIFYRIPIRLNDIQYMRNIMGIKEIKKKSLFLEKAIKFYLYRIFKIRRKQ